jgi:hypothetical protein
MDSAELIHKSFHDKFKYVSQIGDILRDICKDEKVRDKIIDINQDIHNIRSEYDMIVLSNTANLFSGVKLDNDERYIAVVKSGNFSEKITTLMRDLKEISQEMDIEEHDSKILESIFREYNNISIGNRDGNQKYNECYHCKKIMTEDEETGDLTCTSCGIIKKIHGINTFNNDKTKNLHNVAKYFDEWIRKIEGKPSKKVPAEVIEAVRNRAIKTKLINPTYEDIRGVLKYLGKTPYNHFCPYIRWQVTGIKSEQLTAEEKSEIKSIFITAIDIYMEIKPESRTNNPHYPFFIFKIIDLLMKNSERKFKIMDAIHIQERKTIVKNDNDWERVCEKMNNKKIYYKPTNRYYRDEYSQSMQ